MVREPETPGPHGTGRGVDISAIKIRGQQSEYVVRSPNGRPYTGSSHARVPIEGYTAGPSPTWARQMTRVAGRHPLVSQIIGPWEINWGNHNSPLPVPNNYREDDLVTKQNHWHHIHLTIRDTASQVIINRNRNR